MFIMIIYHECEGRIEKSVPRIAFWHHEASYSHTNIGFFLMLITVFIYLSIYFKISFQKSLNMLDAISNDDVI